MRPAVQLAGVLIVVVGVGATLGAGTFGCAPTAVASSDAGMEPPAPDGGCPDGAQLAAAEGICAPVLPATPCPPNTFAEPGIATCVPVGWTTPCPAGFVAASDGWGCVESLPSTPCTGATREDVLSGTCVPIGDCSAPFPPASATLFVDGSYTAAMLDATHFNTIQSAVDAAASGATIAIASGLYTESVGVLGKSLTLAGACAAKVVIQYGPGGSGTSTGLYSDESLTVRGVTVTGFAGGILAEGGAFDLEDSLVTGNSIVGLEVQAASKATVLRSKVTGTTFPAGSTQLGGGVGVLGGSTLDIEDSVVVDNVYANLRAENPMSVITAKRVVASRNSVASPNVPNPASVNADDSAQIVFSQGVIGDAAHLGVFASNHATVTISESVVRSAVGTLASNGGVGVLAGPNGAITVQSSLLAAHPSVGAYVGAGGTLSLESVVLRGPANHAPVEFGRGAQSSGGALTVRNSAFLDLPQSGMAVQAGGSASLDGVFIRGAYATNQAGELTALYGGFALEVEKASTVTIARSAFVGCMFSALSVNTGSKVTAANLLIQGTIETAFGGQGSAAEVFGGASFGLTNGLLLDNVVEGVMVENSTADFAMTTIGGTSTAGDGTFGAGLVALDNANLTLTDVGLNQNASIGLVADDSQVRMQRGAVANNGVGVQAQNGSFLSISDDTSALLTGEVRISTATLFVSNGSKEGSGVVPLPPVNLGP